MSEQMPRDPRDPDKAPEDDVAEKFPPLPAWLASRVLRADENVAWVRGPLNSSPWERCLTHPALFLAALAFAALYLVAARWLAGSWSRLPPLIYVSGGAVVFGSIFVLAISSTYYTRLVVTNLRLVILQGREICRSWNIDDLPRSLIRYGRRGAWDDRTIDLSALKTMMGGQSGQFADAKTILDFGKQLDRIRKGGDSGRER